MFTEGQDWPIEAVCAECSRLAYFRFETDDRIEADLSQALALAGLTDARCFSDPGTGTQAYTAFEPAANRAYIVFRGTQPDDPSDIGTDAQAVVVDWQGPGKVHLGFRDAFNSTWASIETWSKASGAADTWITGHSLGGALATLGAALLPGAHLVNFGSPRVGDAAFAAQFAGRFVKRYVNCCDLVTRLPPEFLGYAHVPGQIYIDRWGRQRAMSQTEMDADMAAARLDYLINESWRFGNAGVRDFADHTAVNYVSGVLQDRT